MAPRELLKPTTKVQRTVKETPAKGRASPIGVIKKTTLVKKTVEKTPLKKINTIGEGRANRLRTNTVPKAATPKPKDNKSVPIVASVTKSSKNAGSTWKRRPKPAHSGVPIPEKMRKMLDKQFLDSEIAQ